MNKSTRPVQRFRILFFVASFIIVGLTLPAAPAAVAAAAAAADADHQLKLKVATFDPAAGLPADFAESAAPAGGLATPPGRGDLYVVQFLEPPAAAEQARLTEVGMKVLDYLPERAFIVRLAAGTKAESLRSILGVRAVVPFAPKLRMSPDLRDLASAKPPAAGGEEARINAWLAADADPHALAEAAQKRFPDVKATAISKKPAPLVQFSGPPARLKALAESLARHPDVLYVDRAWPSRLLNDQSVWIGQSYDRVDGPGEAAAPDPKPYSLSGTVFNHGITGTGQVIGIIDTRLEHQLCYFTDNAEPLVKQTVWPPATLTLDPNHRKILAYNQLGFDSPPYGTWRHGTHTSGSALGDSLAHLSTPASAGHDAGDGMAPNAKLVYLDMNGGQSSNCEDGLTFFPPEGDMFQQEYDAGARLLTNSWFGGGGVEDATVWQKPDLLVFFSAGNDGANGGYVTSEAEAKNVVAVGATESYDATFNYDNFGIRDPENMAAFSSVGPPNGRIKPDITAPGVLVSSAGVAFTYYSNTSDPHCVQGDPNTCFPFFGGCYVSDLSQTCSTVKLSGTSMSSPTAAGLGALARQYFTDGFYPTGQATPTDARIPSAALLKAVLINGARNMTGHILDGNGYYPRTDLGPLPDAPSNRQGWGRVTLDDALYFAGDSRKLFLADIPSDFGSGVGTRDRLVYKVDVTSTTSPLKFTLVWTDPPASPPAGQLVRNDLDLVVTAPDGKIYKGNQWTVDNINVPGDMESAPNPTGKDINNNVEGVLIHSPQIGQYRFEVQGANVPGYQTLFTQGFAVVVTGEFTGGFAFPMPPRVDSVSPNAGANNNPTPITINGDRFEPNAQVYLGTTTQPQKYALTSVMVFGQNIIQATVPVNLQSGTYILTVLNPDGMSGTLTDAFTIGAPLQNATLYIAGPNPNTNAADQVVVIDLAQGILLPPVTLTVNDDPVDVAVNRTAGKGVIAEYGYGGQAGRVGIVDLNAGKVTTNVGMPAAVQGRRPWAVAIHPSGNPAYVLSALVNGPTALMLSRLDLTTGTFTGTPLTLGLWGDLAATDLEVSPDGQRVYATNPNDDTLSVIRTSDFTEIARVTVGDGPDGIAVSPDSTKVYVANYFANSISIVDATSLTTVSTIDLTDPQYPTLQVSPKHVVVSPDGTKLYVGSMGAAPRQVATVDLATGSVTQTKSMGAQIEKVAYVPSLAKLFALEFSNDVVRLTPATLQTEWTQAHGVYASGMDWVEPVALTITSAVPSATCVAGGTVVTITGSAFQGEVRDDTGTIVQQRTRVFFGNIEATSVTLVDSMHLSAVAPAQAAGYVNVQVQNPNGQSATLTNGAHYHSCVPLGVAPASNNFGTSSVGETSAAQSFTVTNYGNHDPVHVGTVAIGGTNPYDFTVTSNACTGQTLVTNSTCVVQVSFRPTALGSRSGTLSISSDDPDNPVISATLSGSAQTALYNLVELPNSDAGPNQGTPSPSGAHYLDVDDDPNDGDTTFLTFSGSGQKEIYTIADALHDTDVVASVKVRWTAKNGAGGTWTAKAGVVVGSTEYYGPTVNLSASYTTREEVFANNPATGQPWTVANVRAAKLVYQQVTIQTQLPRAALTEIVLVVAVRRVPFASSLLEPPNADVGPNQGQPTPSVSSHYLNVDEDPNDGGTTILSFTSGGLKEVYAHADQLLNTDIVTEVKVRWTAKKGSGSGWTGKAGVVVGSTEYYGPTIDLPTNYTMREESFVLSPATGQPWTVQEVRNANLIYQQVAIVTQLPRASLTQLVLVVSVLRMPVLATLTELPNSDAGPNQASPTPVVSHYLDVDDDPNDGDTTMLSFTAAGNKEVFTTADQLLDTDHVQSVKVRWVAKKGQGNNWSAKAGLVVSGTEYYGSTVTLPTNYTVFEETFGTNPATTQFWTVQDVRAAKLIYQQVTAINQLPKARLTEMVLIVQVERAP